MLGTAVSVALLLMDSLPAGVVDAGKVGDRQRGGGRCLAVQQSLQDSPDFKMHGEIELSLHLDHNNPH